MERIDKRITPKLALKMEKENEKQHLLQIYQQQQQYNMYMSMSMSTPMSMPMPIPPIHMSMMPPTYPHPPPPQFFNHPPIPPSPSHSTGNIRSMNNNKGYPQKKMNKYNKPIADQFDPLNPSNPGYNYIRNEGVNILTDQNHLNNTEEQQDEENDMSKNIYGENFSTNNNRSQTGYPAPTEREKWNQQHGITLQQQYEIAQRHYPTNPTSNLSINTNHDINNEEMIGPSLPNNKRKLEVIIDSKRKALIPRSLLVKRKEPLLTTNIRPKKKLRLDIAPDVDGLDTNVPLPPQFNNTIVAADDAYADFMDDINELI